ncbi:FKBP-type peptidyl-prolyl cis-trans isomerase [Methylibium sp.]|uniref:FKBP-type peptidyl-prolyl cis-trans isomerase n=1 Tax=Methylibium sp. TaxID=2067992 RepID=UPI003D0A15DB
MTTTTAKIAPLLCTALLSLSALAAQAQPDVLANAAKEPGAVVTPSGLVYQSLKDGSGGSPRPSDVVKVHYSGKLTDGREFDSSYKRGQPIEFPLNRVIPCWTEGVQRMKVGGRAKLTCPPDIAYGPSGAGGGLIPPNATLVFEIELLGLTAR